MTKKDRDKIILINQAYFSHYQSMQVLCISSLIPRPHLCQIQSLAVRLLHQNHLHRLPMWEILVQRKIKSINVPMLCGDCRDLVYTGYITTWLHAATHMHASTAALGRTATCKTMHAAAPILYMHSIDTPVWYCSSNTVRVQEGHGTHIVLQVGLNLQWQ